MSGLSLAVAARLDPNKEAETPVMGGGVMGSLRTIELQLVAFIVVFSASGLVPPLDLVFPAFTTVYIILLSRLALPPRNPSPAREVFHGSRMFQAHVALGTALGLFLPLAYVLGGFARGDRKAVRSAAPHLFLLSCQILTEGVVGGMARFTPPARAMVPLMYTVRRVFVIADWNQAVWAGGGERGGWAWFGKGLALANLAYFSVNLFGFLIPRFLPRAFERYFRDRDGEDMTKKVD